MRTSPLLNSFVTLSHAIAPYPQRIVHIVSWFRRIEVYKLCFERREIIEALIEFLKNVPLKSSILKTISFDALVSVLAVSSYKNK